MINTIYVRNTKYDHKFITSFPGALIAIHSIQNPFISPLAFVPLSPNTPVTIDGKLTSRTISFNEWDKVIEEDFLGKLGILATACYFPNDKIVAFRTKYSEAALVNGRPKLMEKRAINVTYNGSLIITCAILNNNGELTTLTKAFHDDAVNCAFNTRFPAFS